MLRQLRSQKLMKGIMIGVLAVVIPSFVVFYGWQSYVGGNSGMLASGVAAEIKFGFFDKQEIQQSDLTEARRYLTSQYRIYSQLTSKNIDRSTVDRIMDTPTIISYAVNLELLKRFAQKQGIVVSDDEVLKALDERYPPQTRRQLIDALARQSMSLEQFAMATKYDMLLDRVRNLIASQAHVSLYEAWLDYSLINEKLTADYVRFNVADVAPTLKIDEGELNAYFEQTRDKFRIPDQVMYAFLAVNKGDLRSSITATADEITSYYNQHREEYRMPRMAHARQIFLKKPVPRPGNKADEEMMTTVTEALKVKANEIFQRAAKGEDFAFLADQFTEEKVFPPREDSGTTAPDANTTTGGNLGYIAEPTAQSYYGEDWTSSVFHMKPGAISRPIETPRGIGIVKLEALREGVLQLKEKVEEVIKDRIVDEKVSPVFDKAGEEMRIQSQKHTSIDKLAEALQLKLKMTPKTDKGARFIPGLGSLGEFELAISDLQKGGRTEALSDSTRHMIIEVREEFPAHDPALDEVRDKASAMFRETKALEQVRAKAGELKSKSANPEAFKTAATEMGTTIVRSQPFTRAEAASILGPIEKFASLSEQVKAGDIQMTPIGAEKAPAGYVVWSLAAITPPDRAEFSKNLAELMRNLVGRKAETIINEYLRDSRRAIDKKVSISPAFRGAE
ncbi:MAG: peptidyl-prolyl cis-trans isomerase [Candidatus Sumerlaeota bacterium]|nr:peptidyl-prolyl cis-trans isomerase [Candidatus Sumerlaeota bacterium]